MFILKTMPVILTFCAELCTIRSTSEKKPKSEDFLKYKIYEMKMNTVEFLK